MKHTMERLSFSKKWINLIVECITTSSFSVIINGAAEGLISPKGLKARVTSIPIFVFVVCRGFL